MTLFHLAIISFFQLATVGCIMEHIKQKRNAEKLLQLVENQSAQLIQLVKDSEERSLKLAQELRRIDAESIFLYAV